MAQLPEAKYTYLGLPSADSRRASAKVLSMSSGIGGIIDRPLVESNPPTPATFSTEAAYRRVGPEDTHAPCDHPEGHPQ